jgi:Cu(I)/Ag(I) efflux system membrane fusion protein
MNSRTLIILTALGGLLAGFVLTRMLDASHSVQTPVSATEESAVAEREVLYWVAPMDSSFRRDGPGKSPMGMDLVPVFADPGNPGDYISIDSTVTQNLGVRTALAEVRPMWRRIEATGYFSFDETRLSQINMRTPGWVQSLALDTEGERVNKGDLLFEFYSPDMVNAQKEYIQALSRPDNRMRSAARGKLLALGMLGSEIEQLTQRGVASETIRVVAPQDGILVKLSVSEGMFVRPENEVMSFADLSSIWLQAEVFESQADWVAKGQSAEARLSYMPGEVFSGMVDYVYPVLDPNTRTLRVRLRFDNPDERLKPNMYAGVSIFGKTHQAALSVPRESIIRSPLRDRLVVSLGDGKFQVHEVMTGIESGDWIEIIAGLRAGDEVVTSAQFLIDSEASLAGSIRRLNPSDHATMNQLQDSIFGSGRVENIDLERRRIRMTHGPIEALGWPSMTMEFDVAQNVTLEQVRVGQSLHFSIRADREGTYLVDMIHLVDAAGTDPEIQETQND